MKKLSATGMVFPTAIKDDTLDAGMATEDANRSTMNDLKGLSIQKPSRSMN
jgi:hypothetical protein